MVLPSLDRFPNLRTLLFQNRDSLFCAIQDFAEFMFLLSILAESISSELPMDGISGPCNDSLLQNGKIRQPSSLCFDIHPLDAVSRHPI